MKGINCCIGSCNAIEIVRDKVINVERSTEHSLDKFWDIRATLETSKSSSLPDSARHKLEWTGADFVSRCGNTDNAGYSPSTVGTLQCRSHDIDISSTVETVVHTPLGHGTSNVFLNGDISKRWWIDAISGTKLLGDFEFFGVDINGDDLGRSSHFGTLNDSEANCTKTEHSNGRVRFNLAGIPNGTKTRRDSASKEACLAEVGLFVDFGARNFGNDGVLTHSTTSHKMENILSLTVLESDGSIRHDSLSLGASNLGTKVGLGTLAKDTSSFTALRSVAWNDMVADTDTRHTGSNGLHDAPGLVSQNARV